MRAASLEETFRVDLAVWHHVQFSIGYVVSKHGWDWNSLRFTSAIGASVVE